MANTGIIKKRIVCPKCNETTVARLHTSINVTNYKDLREKTMDESLFKWKCQSCGYSARLTYPVLYNDMKKRLQIFNAAQNNVVMSIHQNQFSNTSSHGTQVFYSPNHENSLRLADAIKHSVTAQLQPENERQSKPAGKEIFLLKNATVPAVIVECGFLSNPAEREKLIQDSYQKDISFAITTGFLDYWNTN